MKVDKFLEIVCESEWMAFIAEKAFLYGKDYVDKNIEALEREFTLKIQRMSDEEKKKMLEIHVDRISELVKRRRKNDR